MVHNDYKWCLFVCALTCVHYFIVGGLTGIGRKAFSQEVMNEKFGELHAKELEGQKISKGGLPDAGNGRYTMELGYATWMKMGQFQRAHLNYHETLLQTLFYILAGGIGWPTTFAILGGVNLLGRIIFVFGYLKAPRMRFFGVILFMPLLMVLPVLTIVSLVNVAIA